MPSLTLANSLRATITYSPFSPASLFSGGAPGVWYDPSDYTTLFQDSAGTTPVTAVEQPVGLMLDKSQGLVLGPEATSGAWLNTYSTTFDTFTSTGPNSFTATTTGAKTPRTRVNVDIPSAGWYVMQLTATFSGGLFATSGVASSGSPYSPAIALSVPTVSGAPLKFYFYATGAFSSFVLNWNATGASTLSVIGVTVKELPGNHAFQSTSASRPVLSARYNLLTKTEQFDDAAWSKIETTVASGFTDSVGASKAWKLQENSANANHLISILPTGVSSTTNRWSVEVKAGERNYVLLFGAGIGGAYFNLTDGTSVNYSTAPDNKGSVNLGNGWWRIWIEKNAITSNCQLYTSDTGSRFVYQGTAGSGIYFAFPDLRPTNQSTLPYQRVNTSTDYATTGFLPYLKFDGVDDSMSTNSISFTSTDKMSVFAGVRKLGSAPDQIIIELSSSVSANNGAFWLAADVNSSTEKVSFATKGTVFQAAFTTSTAYNYPVTVATTGIGDISGDRATLRINGVQVAQNTGDQGTGNYGNYPLFIGRRNNASLPFNGQLYSMTIVGKQVTATELSSTETYTAIKTGVTLA